MSESSQTSRQADVMAHVFLDAAANTTCHGLPHLVRTDINLLRATWLACFLASSAAACYFSAQTLLAYLDFDVVTKIRVVPQRSAPFPAISLCNKNSLVTAESAEFSLRAMQAEYGPHFHLYPAEFFYLYYFSDDLRFSITTAATSPNVTDSIRRSFGVPLERTLIRCVFNYEACDVADFEWFFSNNYGNCYRFNGDRRKSEKVVTKDGHLNGLSVELIVPRPVSTYAYSRVLGMHVIVHNKSAVAPTYFDGFDVATGAETSVALARVVARKKARPYSACVDRVVEAVDSVFTRFFRDNKLEYRQKDCFNYCYQRRVVDVCGCHDASFASMTFDASARLSFTQLTCQADVYKTFFHRDAQANCTDECPLECESISFAKSFGTSVFPTRFYAKQYLTGLTIMQPFLANVSASERFDAVRESVLSLRIFYDTLDYTCIEESAKTELIDLISGLGGMLGLFVGFSFLSLVEVVDLVVKLLNAFKDSSVAIDRATTLNGPMVQSRVAWDGTNTARKADFYA